MRIADSKTTWVKFGKISKIVFIGKETICFGSGCHLLFHNLSTNEEQIYTANSTTSGDGICCYTGHRTSPIFAFAENNKNPRVFIKNYPNFDEICTLENKTGDGYIDLVFSDRSLLITLGNLPNFNITVWNWRSWEKILVKETGIFTDNQILRCSLGSLMMIVQLAIETKKIQIWEVLPCGRESFLKAHEIEPLKNDYCNFIDCLWTTEGALFILDNKANVYLLTETYDLKMIIEYTTPGKNRVSFCWFKAGITIAGPNKEIRHYKKCDTWSIDWTVVPPVPLKKITSTNNILVAISKNNQILQISQDQHEFIKNDNPIFNDICLINPIGRFIVALSNDNKLNVYEISTGEKVSELILKEKILTMCENPLFPYLVLGYDTGIIDFISTYDPNKLIQLTQFYLMKKPITNLHFHQYGRIFVAANLNYGHFFILEGVPNGEMKIIGWIDGNRQFTDFTLIVSTNCYQIFAIPVTEPNRLAGYKIMRYCLIKKKRIRIHEYLTEDANVYYTKISTIFHRNRERVFYGISTNDRSIHRIQIKNNSIIAVIKHKIPTGHQLKGISLKLTQEFALTWSFDGFLILRDSYFNVNIGLCLPHHRYNGGVKKALVDPYGKYLLSLGYDNNLICTELINTTINEFNENKIRSIDFINWTTLTRCWLEDEELKRSELERAIYRSERHSIREEIHNLRRELIELYETNLISIESERLETVQFYLDKQVLMEKERIAQIKQTNLGTYLFELIVKNNEIAEWLIANCFDKMEIPSQRISGICASLEVENFGILKSDLAIVEHSKWLEELKKIEYIINPEPFRRCISMEIETTEDTIALFGSEIQKYIDLADIQMNQLNIQNYYEIYREEQLSKVNCIHLKEYFNREFEKLFAIKIKDIENIKEQNQRLRHIQSEINYFETVEPNLVEINDPILTHFENPEIIKIVHDDEIIAKPVISEDEMVNNELNEKISETGTVPLGDKFYDNAVEITMKSVLETRWEDELKKDIPLPELLEGKHVSEYSDEDRKALEEYEEKWRILEEERAHYKQLLKLDFAKIQDSIHQTTEKFNHKLMKLYILQLKMKSIEIQEQLKFDYLKFNHKQLADQRNYIETKLINRIKNLNHTIEDLEEFLNRIQEIIESDCKKSMKDLQNREKMLQEAFKKDIQELPTTAQEHAVKIYKKRSKVVLRNLNSTTMLNQLAKSVVTREILPNFNQDCIEFLNSLDQLDLFVGVPPAIDETTFNSICKHRRLRIEYEFNWKAVQINLTESQATLNQLQKEYFVKKGVLEELKETLMTSNDKYIETKLNTPIQLIIPQGLVEFQQTGDLKDFNNVMLIQRKDIDEINEIIFKFGNKKLKQLQLGILYDQKILVAEWKHQYMKMTIEDFQEKIKDIGTVRVTKNLQSDLENQEERFNSVDKEMKMVRITFENLIKQEQNAVEKLQKQIKVLKQKNQKLDKQISEINIDVCEYNLQKDQKLEIKEKKVIQSRMAIFLKRTNLMKQIQQNHSEMLILQAELELKRLAVYPTLPYRIIE